MKHKENIIKNSEHMIIELWELASPKTGEVL